MTGSGMRFSSVAVENHQISKGRRVSFPFHVTSSCLPQRFKRLLKVDISIRKLWQNPDPSNDTSRHDWMLGLRCVEIGITKPEEMAAILIGNPHGKYRRDLRENYLQTTVRKLIRFDKQCESDIDSERLRYGSAFEDELQEKTDKQCQKSTIK